MKMYTNILDLDPVAVRAHENTITIGGCILLECTIMPSIVEVGTDAKIPKYLNTFMSFLSKAVNKSKNTMLRYCGSFNGIGYSSLPNPFIERLTF